MATLDPKALTTNIEKGQIKPLYLLVGEETFMIDEALETLQTHVLADGLADFNRNIFYASDSDVEQIRDAVQTLPMMASKRLVILKQAQDLSASELEGLTALVDDPVDTCVFVLVANKADMRKKFFKTFESKGVIVKFQKPFENQLDPWVHSIAKKHGLKLDADCVELLKQWLGANLTEINNEMAKLSQYCGDRREVTAEDIKSVVSKTRIETVFEFVNCVGRKDCAGSFVHLAQLLDNGQNEVGVLALTIRHFRILLLCQEALKEGLSSSQIASRVGVHGFFIKDYIDQAKDQDTKHLLKIYDLLLDTDRALKSNPLSSHLWLENLVLQACQTLPV